MSVLLTLALLVTVTSPCSVWASAVRPSLTTTTASTTGAPSLAGPGSNSTLSTNRGGSTTQSSVTPGGSATNTKENSTDGSSSTSTTTTRTTTTEADVTTNAGGTSDFGETTPGAAPPVNNVTTVTPEETATRLASGDGCIESEIPNVMNIGQCLGDDLDLCAGKTTVMQAYMSLVRCTAKGTFENMSPLNGLIALRDIFTTIVHRFSPRVLHRRKEDCGCKEANTRK